MKTSIAASAFGMVWVAVALGMPLTMFLECMTGSAVMVGLMVTVEQIATVAQIPAAWMAERFRRRMPLWAVTALVHRLLWFVPAVIPFVLLPGSRSAFWVLVLALAISAILQRMSIPVWFSWMGELVPASARSRFWGYRQSIVTVVQLAAVIGTGYILDAYPDPRQPGGSYTGFAIVFGLAGLFGVVDIVIHCFVPEPPNPRPSQGLNVWQRIIDPLKSREFLWVTAGFGMWLLSVSLTGAFSILYLSREFDTSFSWLAATGVSGSVGAILAGLVLGPLMDRVGARALGAALMIVSPLFGVVWFFMNDSTLAFTLPLLGHFDVPQPIALLLVTNVMAGAAFSGVALSQVNLSTALAPREGRTMAMAVHWSLVGALGSLGPLVGGFVTDWLSGVELSWRLPGGGSLGFVHVLIVLQALTSWFIAVPLLMKVRRRERELPVNFLVGNPLRAANLLVNLGALSSSASPDRRAFVLRRIGRKRHREATADVIERLADPALRVREEAVEALGRIGDDAAVMALIEAFESERADLAPNIARALGIAEDSRAVSVLVKRLDDPDREVVFQCIRSLGAIGDPRAAKPLRGLLANATDERTIDAAANALADIGDLGALEGIVRRQRGSASPLLKRSLAVAAGDLVSGRDEFYAAIARERREHGSDVVKRLDHLNRLLKNGAGGEHERNALAVEISRVEAAYEQGRLRDCCGALFQLASLMAAKLYGDSAKELFDAPRGNGPRRARTWVGLWYIRTLTEEEVFGNISDWVEPLLGIFFLTVWVEDAVSLTWSRRRRSSPKGHHGNLR